MPNKNPLIRKEYARLSMAIKKGKERGNDISQLLQQRARLISINGISESISINNSIKDKNNLYQTFTPKQKPKKNLFSNQQNQLLENVLNEVKQIKEQNNLLQYELSEYFKEKENQQLRISQLEQTISELQSQNQTLIKTISEKKSESKTEEKNTIKKLILTPQLRKQLKKETANMVK
jgi:hypothetical protein